MSQVIKCDICGETENPIYKPPFVRFKKLNSRKNDEKYDICEDCVRRMRKLMQEEKEHDTKTESRC